jgi:hypothetical protein
MEESNMEIKLEKVVSVFEHLERLHQLYVMNQNEAKALIPQIDDVNDDGVELMREMPDGASKVEAMNIINDKFQGLTEEYKSKMERANHWASLYAELDLVITKLGLYQEYDAYKTAHRKDVANETL